MNDISKYQSLVIQILSAEADKYTPYDVMVDAYDLPESHYENEMLNEASEVLLNLFFKEYNGRYELAHDMFSVKPNIYSDSFGCMFMKSVDLILAMESTTTEDELINGLNGIIKEYEDFNEMLNKQLDELIASI